MRYHRHLVGKNGQVSVWFPLTHEKQSPYMFNKGMLDVACFSTTHGLV